MLLTKVKIYQLICVDTFLGQCSILRFKFFTQYDLTTELWYFISLPPGHNNMYNIISPTSVLLSATGTLAFKNCGLSDEVSTFTPPELLQGRASSTKPAIERVRETLSYLCSYRFLIEIYPQMFVALVIYNLSKSTVSCFQFNQMPI